MQIRPITHRLNTTGTERRAPQGQSYMPLYIRPVTALCWIDLLFTGVVPPHLFPTIPKNNSVRTIVKLNEFLQNVEWIFDSPIDIVVVQGFKTPLKRDEMVTQDKGELYHSYNVLKGTDRDAIS